jgi:hypothetical protein
MKTNTTTLSKPDPFATPPGFRRPEEEPEFRTRPDGKREYRDYYHDMKTQEVREIWLEESIFKTRIGEDGEIEVLCGEREGKERWVPAKHMRPFNGRAQGLVLDPHGQVAGAQYAHERLVPDPYFHPCTCDECRECGAANRPAGPLAFVES